MGIIKGDVKLFAIIELMKEFNETAKIWGDIIDSEVDVLPFADCSYRNPGSLAHINPVNGELAYDPDQLTPDILIHEGMHARQYMNCSTLLRSTHFYSGAYHDQPLPEDSEDEFVIFTPQAMVESHVAMETAVWASVVSAMYEFCHAIDDEPMFGDFLRASSSGLGQVYPPLYENGKVRFSMSGGEDFMQLALPSNANTPSLRSQFSTAAVAQLNYAFLRNNQSQKLLKDVYAETAAAVPAGNAEHLRAHEGFAQGRIKFTDFEDAHITEIGDVWTFNMFADPNFWRGIEASAPIMGNPETAEKIKAANAALNVDKFKIS